jgi:hypothetical protein
MLKNDDELTSASNEQNEARTQILNFTDEMQSPEHLLRNILCVTPTPQIARLLSLYSVYLKILEVSGDILEFGVWYGQNLMIMENLRAILEPFNKRRAIIGFDSFQAVGRDADSINKDYYLGTGFAEKVLKQLTLHEQSNILGHVSNKHEILVGDIVDTLPAYAERERAVAAMMIDVPGKLELNAIFECAQTHLLLGGVLILDDLNDRLQADVSRTFLKYKQFYKVSPCPFLPSRSIAERVSL